jgi:YidC/Oxa1 family membrane protein insertase
MVYRPEAFDHFCAILCAGPHHEAETRAREALKGLREKELVKHGYGRLDAILAEGVRGPRPRKPHDQIHVLVAPTWGDNVLLESHGKEVVGKLLNAGLRVTVRPHPRTRKLLPAVLIELGSLFGGNASFSIDEDANARRSLHAADVMVSDWSGAALEFAMGLERPVIFIDVPRKVQNPTYAELGIEPLESQIRSEIGVVLSPGDLHYIGQLAQDMAASAKDWQAAAQSVRSRWVFNHGQSGSAAAAYLHSLVST